MSDTAREWAEELKAVLARRPRGLQHHHPDRLTLWASVNDDGSVSVWVTTFRGSMGDSRVDLPHLTVDDLIVLGDWARGLVERSQP